MTTKTILRAAVAAGCCLNGCGERPNTAAESPSATAPDKLPIAAPARDAGDVGDADRVLRQVEHTLARPVPRPLLPLLELESGGPAGGELR
jgi:hypothetical protein